MSNDYKIYRSNDNDLRRQITDWLQHNRKLIDIINDRLDQIEVFSGVYKFSTDIAPPPNEGYIEFSSADPSLVNEVYIHTIDQNGVDGTASLAAIIEGDKLLVNDTDVGQLYEFRATGVAVIAADVATVPVQNVLTPVNAPVQNANLVVSIAQGISLDNLVDVAISNPTEGEGIWFDEDTGLWKNRAPYQESWPTGLANGGELNIGPGANDIEVITGVGVVIDAYTEPLGVPAALQLRWDQINTPITAAPAVAGSVVWFAIQDSGTPAVPPEDGGIEINIGQLVQSASPFTPQQQRANISLGVAVHNGVEWKEISSPKVINQSVETLRELAVTVLGPTFIIEGGEVTEAPTFTLDQASGVVWENNRNWHVDKSDPNREALPAQSPITFEYVNRDFTSVGGPTTVVDPTMYDNGTGAPVSVPGPANTCTVQRLYIDPANNYWVAWGQTTYPNFFAAEASIQADLAGSVVPFILQQSILLGFIVTEKAKNDWDIDEAVFIPAIGGGGQQGGGGTPITRHDQLVDVSHDDINPHGNSRWQYPYLIGATYEENDFVRDEGWLMIANIQTTDRAAPQTVGDPAYILPDIPGWTIYSNNSAIFSGHLYTFTSPGYLRSIRIWVPELTDDTNYAIVIVRNPNSANPILSRVNDPDLTENDWSLIGTDTLLVTEGEELLVYIDALNSGSSVSPGGTPADWIRATSSNTAVPLTGQWNTNVQETLLRIHQNDADANLIDLSGVIPGSTFQFVDVNDPNTSITFLAQSGETLVAGVYSWTVVVDSIGTNGAPAPTDRCLTTIIVPVAAATKFVGIDTYWGPGTLPNWAGIESFLQYDGVAQPVQGDEAYGIDIAFQELVTSPDWDIVSAPAGGGGGGGGSFTPEVFAGAGTTGYVPDPITEANKMLRDDGSWDFVDYGEITNPPTIITDHGGLSGLGDDDHTQYHNNARGDARYTPIAHQTNYSNPHQVTYDQLGGSPPPGSTLWAVSGSNIYNTNSGNVGIGTTSPRSVLEAVTTPLDWTPTQTGGWQYTPQPNEISIYSDADVGANKYVGLSMFPGDQTANGNRAAARIVAIRETDSDTSTAIAFWSRAAQETMRIAGDGNVGIGTTSPAYKLEVVGNPMVTGSGNPSDAQIGFRMYVGDRTWFIGKPSADALAFGFGANAQANEKMRITAAGNVGIGTTSPTVKLDVTSGAIHVDCPTDFWNQGADHINIAGCGSITTNGSNAVDILSNGYRNASGGWTSLGIAGNVGASSLRLLPTGDVRISGQSSTPTGIDPAPRLIVKGDTGRVGIGTTSPSTTFHTYSTNFGTPTSGTTVGVGYRHQMGNVALDFGTYDAGPSFIQNRASSGSATYALILQPLGGNVGIGTTSPGMRLHVDNQTAGVTAFKAGGLGGGAIWVDNVGGGSNYYNAGEHIFRNASSSEAMRITSAGDVGIGTTNPSNYSGFGTLTLNGTSGSVLSFMRADVEESRIVVVNSMLFYMQGTERMRITNTGFVGIGTTNPIYVLDVAGTIRASSDVIAYSDRRLKKNLEPISNALDKLMTLTGYTYDRIDAKEKTRQAGVIAQEVQEVLPEAVYGCAGQNDYMSVAPAQVMALILQAVKELAEKVDAITD